MSLAARTFDGLGWACPVLLSLRLVLKRVPTVKNRLDSHLAADILEVLRRSLEQFDLPAIIQPRYRPVGTPARLHLFADASGKAMAVAAYLAGPDGARLLMAKSRVKPSDWDRGRAAGDTSATVLAGHASVELVCGVCSDCTGGRTSFTPQMELAAVELATRMLKFLRTQLDTPPLEPATIWTDSQCTPHWLTSYERKIVFVENRVRKARQVPGVCVRYVPTHDNPADLGTRGTKASELLQC